MKPNINCHNVAGEGGAHDYVNFGCVSSRKIDSITSEWAAIYFKVVPLLQTLTSLKNMLKGVGPYLPFQTITTCPTPHSIWGCD